MILDRWQSLKERSRVDGITNSEHDARDLTEKNHAGHENSGRLVCVIGTENFFHQALCIAMEKELGIPCVNIGDIKKLGGTASGKYGGTVLYMVNHSGIDYESVLLSKQTGGNQSHREAIVALFNLPSRTGIEKAAFARGVQGFFYRSDDLKHVTRGISALIRGDLWVPRDILVEFALKGSKQHVHLDREKTLLTDREAQILALVSVGSTNEEIAEKLFVSHHTVKTHLYNIFKKIDVPNRFQAALWAAKNL
jgi:DNA-binding NarL/FixJ family response regulator